MPLNQQAYAAGRRAELVAPRAQRARDAGHPTGPPPAGRTRPVRQRLPRHGDRGSRRPHRRGRLLAANQGLPPVTRSRPGRSTTGTRRAQPSPRTEAGRCRFGKKPPPLKDTGSPACEAAAGVDTPGIEADRIACPAERPQAFAGAPIPMSPTVHAAERHHRRGPATLSRARRPKAPTTTTGTSTWQSSRSPRAVLPLEQGQHSPSDAALHAPPKHELTASLRLLTDGSREAPCPTGPARRRTCPDERRSGTAADDARGCRLAIRNFALKLSELVGRRTHRIVRRPCRRHDARHLKQCHGPVSVAGASRPALDSAPPPRRNAPNTAAMMFGMASRSPSCRSPPILLDRFRLRF